MAFWDFVKDAGKSVFGSAEAAEAKTPEQADTERKVKALEAEVKALGLDSGDVHLTLRGGDTVKVESKGADRETMEKLILAVGNIKGIARVEADLPKADVPFGAAAAAEPAVPPASAPAAAATPAAAPAGAAAAAPADAPLFHTVKKGETLSAIAQHYLGKASLYPKIFEANRPMLSDPDKIYPGQTLRIPR